MTVRQGLIVVGMVAACGSPSSEQSDRDKRPSRSGESSRMPSEEPEFLARRARHIATAPRVPRVTESLGIVRDLADDTYGCTVSLVADPPFDAPHEALLEDVSMMDATLHAAEYARTGDGWTLRQQLSLNSGSYPGHVFTWTTVLHHVAATPVACSGEPDCVDWMCGELRAVPGGPAEIPHRTATPEISVVAYDGEGGLRGGTELWRDGLVHHFGERCPTWRGREARVEPARVRAAIEALSNLTAADSPRTMGCADCPTTQVRLRTALVRRFILFSFGDSRAKERAFEVVQEAVGQNPCM